MKTTVKLNESDLRKLLAERFDASPDAIRIHYIGPQQDGPHHSPASVSVEIDIDDDSAPAMIGRQTVIVGNATFGSTTIVMPRRGGS